MNSVPLTYAANRARNAAAFSLARASSIPGVVWFGIALASIVPAIFWASVIWGFNAMFNWGISNSAIGTLTAAIAIFLSVVCSAVMAAAS